MKKQFSVFLIISLLFLNLQWVSISASAAENETDFEITENKTGVTITKYNGTAKKVDIPQKINNKNVTEIGDGAFYNKGLTSVTIPESITKIGDYAFDLNQLKAVKIPSRVTNIGLFAFAKNELTQVTIPSSVKKIGYRSFAENKLKSVTIEKGIKEIGGEAFYSNQLTSVVIPNSVTKIESLAFSDNQLKKVTIPNSVTDLADSVFYRNKLTEVTLPSSLKTIKYATFADNKLTKVTIPKSVKTIEEYAFENNNLKTVTFKGAVTTIKQNAFIPQNNGKYFIGWYSDKSYKSKWNFTVKSPKTIYSKWKQVSAINAKEVTVTNNIASDKINLKGLTKGLTYRIYTDKTLKKKLTSFTATGTSQVLKVEQVGAKAGALYIVASKSGYLSSDATKVSFKAQPTKALLAKNVKVTNGKKQDIIKFTGLKKGTKYVIYKDAKKKTKLASFTAKGIKQTVTIKQLGKKAGKIYITAQESGYSVSGLTTIKYSKEK